MRKLAVVPRSRAGSEVPVASRSYPEGVPASLEYPDAPLHALLEDAAREYTQADATWFRGTTRTYRSIQRDVAFFSGSLRRLGVHKGDRIALLLPNAPQFVVAFFAALRLGAVAVPLPLQLTPRELQHRLADSGAETVIATLALYHSLRFARGGTSLRNVVVSRPEDELPLPRRALARILSPRAVRGDEDVRWMSDLLVYDGEPVSTAVHPADPAVLLYAGGAAGAPRSVVHSHRALLANTLQCRAWIADLVDARATVLAAVSFSNALGVVGGVCLAAQAAAMLVFPSAGKGGLRADVALVPAAGGPRVDAARVIACHGSPESGAVTHAQPTGTAGARAGSVGLPLPDVRAKIVDAQVGTRDLGPDEIGELAIRGPQIMDGYHERPDDNARVMRGGWIHTGHPARIDRDGFAYLVGRDRSQARGRSS